MRRDPTAVKVGLHHLRRLRGEIALLEAIFVAVLKTETGRDTTSTLARVFGMSNAEAAKAVKVAGIVERVPSAGDALASGSVSAEHVRHLGNVKDNGDAAELLTLAPSQTPEEFGRTVETFLIERDAKSVKDRQRKARRRSSSRPTTVASECA